ncbi:MAG: anti-phage ZorAB system protein ZorA, partial [Ghiorsea sp.]
EIGSGGTQHLKDGISGMIHAASIAFTTSFWGVFASVIFNVIEKLYESYIRNSISSLQDQIDQILTRIKPEAMLMDISNHTKSSDETMHGLAEKIGERMQESVSKMGDDMSAGVAQAIHDVLAPAIGKLVASSEDMTKRQTESSEDILKNLLDNFSHKFSEMGEEQGKMMQASAQNLQAFMTNAKGEQDRTVRRAEIMDEKREVTLANAITQISKQFNMAAQGFSDRFEQASAVQKQTMDESANKVQEILSRLDNKQQESAERLAEMDQNRERVLKIMIHRLTEQLQQFQLAGKENSQSIENILHQQRALTQSVEKVTDNLTSFASEIEGVTGQLSAAAGEINNGNKILAQSCTSMADAITGAALSNEKVSKSNQATHQELRSLLKKVDESRESAQRIAQRLQVSAQTGDSIFTSLKEHQEGYREALNNHVKELEKQMSNILEQYAKTVSEQTHDRMGAWDRETIKYTDAMRGIVNVMQETVDDM